LGVELEAFKKELEKAHKKSEAPAMVAAVFTADELLAKGEVGVRSAKEKDSIGPDDLWHIGSNGKAMTATLLARLVEKEKLKWDSSLEEVFGKKAKKFHPEAAKIRVEQLLSHTAGLPANPPDSFLRKSWKKGSKKIRKQRWEVALSALEKKPLNQPGSKFGYSNTGYIIAGAVVEELMGMDWETAIKKEVFEPLGMKSVGFGAPSGKQPRGHEKGILRKRVPADEGYDGDNPPIYGPAGGMHLSVADWVLFLQDQLKGAEGKGKLLTEENYAKLRTPVLDRYGLGWGVVGGGKELAHAGSNTLWYALVRLDLERKRGVLVITNDASDKADEEVGDLLRTLRK